MRTRISSLQNGHVQKQGDTGVPESDDYTNDVRPYLCCLW